MKIVDTDNFGGDYPEVIAENVRKPYADVMCAALNDWAGECSRRYYKVVEDSYVLVPGFEP